MSFRASVFLFVQHLIPHQLMNRLFAFLGQSNVCWVKNGFIRIFLWLFPKINMAEAQQSDPYAFENFNAFFTRALKDGVRPLPEQKNQIVSPADGVVSEAGRVIAGRLLQAKKHDYRLDELLAGPSQDWLPYVNGHFVTIYLAPSDYHRVHMPMSATLTKTVYVPGQFFSVNNTTAQGISRLFVKNERLVAHFENEHGPFCMIMVGAMIVGGIETIFKGLYKARQGELLMDDQPLNAAGEKIRFTRGDEFGRFLLGSTVILITPPQMVDFFDLTHGQQVFVGGGIGCVNILGAQLGR